MVRPNQLHRNDINEEYKGRRGRAQLQADIIEAYDLHEYSNYAQALDFLFSWYGKDTERIITAFQEMKRRGVIFK